MVPFITALGEKDRKFKRTGVTCFAVWFRKTVCGPEIWQIRARTHNTCWFNPSLIRNLNHSPLSPWDNVLWVKFIEQLWHNMNSVKLQQLVYVYTLPYLVGKSCLFCPLFCTELFYFLLPNATYVWLEKWGVAQLGSGFITHCFILWQCLKECL